jgi:two-component system response regulator AtoC
MTTATAAATATRPSFHTQARRTDPIRPASKRILIVDDEPTLVDVLVERFINTSYEIETVGTGIDAVRAVKRQRPDVVLLDIKMPNMNGIDVLKEVMKIDKSITVIMITGNMELSVTVEALRHGAFGYVPKPFDFRYLEHLIAVSIGV